jgi:hypothetical protein
VGTEEESQTFTPKGNRPFQGMKNLKVNELMAIFAKNRTRVMTKPVSRDELSRLAIALALAPSRSDFEDGA